MSFVKRLEGLKEQLIYSANLSKMMLGKSLRALFERAVAAAHETIDTHKFEAVDAERRLIEASMNLAALFHPEAHDLRYILSTLRIAKDLERIAALSVNIADSAKSLRVTPDSKSFPVIYRLALETTEMVENMTTALLKENASLARAVTQQDGEIDGLRDIALGTLIAEAAERPQSSAQTLHLIRITRNLERIADHAAAICEGIIFIAEGKLILHEKEF